MRASSKGRASRCRWPPAQAYDATYLLAHAVLSLPGDRLDGPGIKAALEAPKRPYYGVVTTYDKPFGSQDKEALSANMLVVGTVKNGQVTFAHRGGRHLQPRRRRSRQPVGCSPGAPGPRHELAGQPAAQGAQRAPLRLRRPRRHATLQAQQAAAGSLGAGLEAHPVQEADQPGVGRQHVAVQPAQAGVAGRFEQAVDQVVGHALALPGIGDGDRQFGAARRLADAIAGLADERLAVDQRQGGDQGHLAHAVDADQLLQRGRFAVADAGMEAATARPLRQLADKGAEALGIFGAQRPDPCRRAVAQGRAARMTDRAQRRGDGDGGRGGHLAHGVSAGLVKGSPELRAGRARPSLRRPEAC